MLSHAFFDNYDDAVLVAGDGDYVPLIQEVKRLGKNVFVSFFGDGAGLAKEVRLVADRFQDLTAHFVTRWEMHNRSLEQKSDHGSALFTARGHRRCSSRLSLIGWMWQSGRSSFS